MAGSLVAIASETQGRSSVTTTTAMGEEEEEEEWEVEYSRFFNYPSLSSTCPSLRPLHDSQRYRFKGTWLSSSSSSSTASLKLLAAGGSDSEITLVVTFRQKIQEEHYISKLHFSWPQVCCISGFPARGSRVVFVSYKDCVGQIQKFAVRFCTIYESKRFIDSMKRFLEYESSSRLPSVGVESEITSQSEFVPLKELPYRPWEDSNFMTSVGTYSQEMPLAFNNEEVIQHSYSQDTMVKCHSQNMYSALPPSFTSLLTTYCPDLGKAAAESTVPDQADLKFQIAKYLEDSSFQDMLIKVEKVISEMGGDLTL